jgi:hypothetical protein
VPGTLKRFAQLHVVVGLAIEDNRDRPILVEHRLLARRHVDDGKATHDAFPAKRPLLPKSRQRPGRDDAGTPSSIPVLFDCVAR